MGALAQEPQFVRDSSWVRIEMSGKDAFMMTGPANCGKSTLVKYLLNRMRSDASEAGTQLYVLDVDCGQPTFNLAGTISLLKVADSGRSVQPETSPVR